MGKLLKFEFRKILTSKYFYIITAVSVIYALLQCWAFDELQKLVGVSGGLSTYNVVKGTLAGLYGTLLAIFLAIFATSEVANGTDKNIFGKGYGREIVYLSKYIVSLIASFAMALITVLVAFIYGVANWGITKGIEESVIIIVIGQACGILAMHALYFVLAYTIGKIAPAIAMNIVVPLVIELVLMLVGYLVKTDIMPYWIDSLFSSFTGFIEGKDATINILALLGYAVVFGVLGLFINSKKESK